MRANPRYISGGKDWRSDLTVLVVRLRLQADHDQLLRGHDRGVPPGGPGLHHPGLHGRHGLLQAVEAEEQE